MVKKPVELDAGPEQLEQNLLRINFNQLKKGKNGKYPNVLIKAFINEITSPSLRSALINGQAWTNFSPGTQFINDKIFGLFVDKMIRYLLKETPILSSIPAKSIATRTKGQWQLNNSIIKDLRKNKDDYVVKRVDQDCGTGVWIGQKESKASLNTIIEKMSYEPEKFIVQNFEHLSVLDNKIVDLRLHAHVDSEQIIVSNTPWGRAKGIRGNGKVNIGCNGVTSPVVVMRK